jgi:hypothetical protein
MSSSSQLTVLIRKSENGNYTVSQNNSNGIVSNSDFQIQTNNNGQTMLLITLPAEFSNNAFQSTNLPQLQTLSSFMQSNTNTNSNSNTNNNNNQSLSPRSSSQMASQSIMQSPLSQLRSQIQQSAISPPTLSFSSSLSSSGSVLSPSRKTSSLPSQIVLSPSRSQHVQNENVNNMGTFSNLNNMNNNMQVLLSSRSQQQATRTQQNLPQPMFSFVQNRSGDEGMTLQTNFSSPNQTETFLNANSQPMVSNQQSYINNMQSQSNNLFPNQANVAPLSYDEQLLAKMNPVLPFDLSPPPLVRQNNPALDANFQSVNNTSQNVYHMSPLSTSRTLSFSSGGSSLASNTGSFSANNGSVSSNTSSFAGNTGTFANNNSNGMQNQSATFATPSATFSNPSGTFSNPSATFSNPSGTFANNTGSNNRT